MRFTIPRIFTHARVEAVVAFFLMAAILWKGGKTLEITWLLGGVAWLCLVDQWRDGAERLRQVPGVVWILLMGYVLWTVASYLLSGTANYGFDEVARDISFAMIFLWALRTADDTTADRLLAVIVVSALIAFSIGKAVYILQPVDRFVGTFFDQRFHTDYWPNAWAEFLLLAWPLPLFVFRRHRKIALAVSGVLLAGLLLSYSRAGLLAAGAQVALGGAFLVWQKGTAKVWLQSAAIRIAVVGALALALFPGINAMRAQVYPVQSVTEKVTFTSSEGTSSVSERQQFWRQALTLTSAKPLFGWGPYSFRFVQPRMQQHVLATSDHPHNVLLKLSAERGIPAALFFAGLVVVILAASFRVVVRQNDPSFRTIALLVSVVGVLVHNMVDYNLQFVAIALPFWLLLGLLSREGMTGGFSIGMRPQRAAEVLLTTVLMLVLLVEGRFLVLSSLGRHAQAAGNAEVALRWYDAAQHERFSRDLHLSRAELRLGRGELDAAHAALDAYAVQNALDARLPKFRGEVCNAQGDLECATNNYEYAYDLNGWNDLAVLRLFVESLKQSGDRALIDERREEFHDRIRAFAEAIVQNTHFIALSHNVEELMILTREFSSLYPEREPEYVVLGAQAARNADVERERLKSRPPGMLW
jgi:O-antigen ligase